ncbi:predicted protein [Nematostella vectensis]|uniref:Glutathione synthetase n=1 Tax=Nematostella vectensis TaxID=45351 RepID=A7STC4_NEMVE|nr:predicted protein [Nematostella vectensis]|eukprot:XP_001625134.1 predicted protein [Nematostella vectensis]
MDTNAFFNLNNLTTDDVQNLAGSAADFLMGNGVLYRSKSSADQVEHAPFMLFPTPYPRKLFDQAKAVQKDFNELVHKVSLDHEFLKESLQSTMAVDKFMGRIYEMYEQIRKEGIAQPISLSLLRSDYMIDSDKPTFNGDVNDLKIKQVEINTIASSFGCLGSKLPGMGSYVLGLQGKDIPVGSRQLPYNRALEGMAEGLAQAWEFYGSNKAVVVMVVTDDERNAFDQKFLEFHLHQRKPRIPLFRRSLSAILKNGELREDKKLILEGHEVAVVYFRAGYSPSCYNSEDAWTSRLMIERSKAIKCPTMATQLVGTKKVQQVLAEPGVLERFVSDQDALRRIRATFTGLYTLDEVSQSAIMLSS